MTDAVPRSELRRCSPRPPRSPPDEVVTHALSRDVTLPHAGPDRGADHAGQRCDHTRPNTLGPRSLGELNDALDAALARTTSRRSRSPASRSSWPPAPT